MTITESSHFTVPILAHSTAIESRYFVRLAKRVSLRRHSKVREMACFCAIPFNSARQFPSSQKAQ
jgi:hypothetical protein